MLHQEIVSKLSGRNPKYSLPREYYVDEQIFELDMQHIWYSQWLFAIPACELAEPGDYLVHEVGVYSVILVRGNDGMIRAFHNSCRHRGSVLCKSKKGQNPKIVCPYHQWTYELDGQLLWARDMGPDFDASKHGLKTVHCREVAGLVYICLADEAPDFAQFEKVAKDYLAPHDLENSKVAFESTIIEEGNWKLVWENNRECYHCAGNHPSLCRSFPEDPRAIGNNDDGGLASALDLHVERCDAVGAPSAFTIDEDGFWRLVRTPLLEGAESYTLDTKVAVSKPNTSFPFKDAGSLLIFLYPGIWSHFLSDHSIVFRVTPINATKTEVCTKWLVHKDAVEGKDYDVKRLTEVWMATNAEDQEVVENNQRGVLSPAYEEGPYSEIHEGGLIQFTEWYANTIVRALTPKAALAAE